MRPSFHHNEVTVGVAGFSFDDSDSFVVADYPAGFDAAPDGDGPAVAVEEDDVDGEAHAEGVD